MKNHKKMKKRMEYMGLNNEYKRKSNEEVPLE